MNVDLSPKLKAQWAKWQQRFIALKPREQGLVMIAGVAIALMLCDQLFWSPLARSSTQRKLAIDAAQQQLAQVQATRAEVAAKLADDPDAELRRHIQAINDRLAAQNAQLQKLTVDLIPPEAMAEALRKVLSERGKLQLLALRNETAVPAFAPKTSLDGAAQNNESSRVVIYRHGLTLQFKGRYLDIVDYLQALENLPWRFFWEKLDYKVESYPDAIVTLKVYTLSNRESWIGA